MITPFSIRIDDSVLEDLRKRLSMTRWPDEVVDARWEYGTNVAYLRSLCTYWSDAFDWRAREQSLNELPHFRTEIDGLGLHFVHVRSAAADATPLILTHGWPSTFFELQKLIPLLTDSFHLVIPSMPGFGFSDRPTTPFVSRWVPELWVELMRRLGYPRFGAHGGDIGGGVTARLGQRHADALLGVHVTNVYGDIGPADAPPSEAERAFLADRERWDREEWAYGELQGTRPQSLAYGLNDSPAGLAAWIVEKYRAWSDCDGDVERAFSRDDLLTNITIYWATQTIGSSFRPYWDARNDPNGVPWSEVLTPTAVAVFPKDIERPPREFAERFYPVAQWTEMPRGGHFAALEEPGLLADDIRAFFELM